jgi:hypothetical protein
MKRFALVLAGIAALVAGYLVIPVDAPEAADHADSPAAAGNSAADIADVYAFTNNGANKVALIMTFDRGAVQGTDFDTTTTYTFNLSSSDGAGGTPASYRVDCTFAGVGDQTVDCVLTDGGTDIASVSGNVGDDLCSGDGGSGCNGDLRVLTDVFDDPFFFNSQGFSAAVDTVKSVASTLEFNSEGCPDLDAETAGALVGCLESACDDFGGSNGAASDGFAGQNVRAIVVQVTRDSIDEGGDILALWGSTSQGGVQIDRAGRPAISTALVGTFDGDSTAAGNRKDEYNAAADRSTWQSFGVDIQASLAILDALDSE